MDARRRFAPPAAALLIPLLATFYFTFGRSGWVALTAGMLVGLGLDRRPLRPLALLVALAPLLALAVWLSSRRPGLTHAHASLARARTTATRLLSSS